MLSEDVMGLPATTPVPSTHAAGLGGHTVIDDDDLDPESMQVVELLRFHVFLED